MLSNPQRCGFRAGSRHMAPRLLLLFSLVTCLTAADNQAKILLVGNSDLLANDGVANVTQSVLMDALLANWGTVEVLTFAQSGANLTTLASAAMDQTSELYTYLHSAAAAPDFIVFQNDVVADGLGVNYTAVNAENAAALETLMQLAAAQQAQSMVLQNVAWYQGDPAYPLLFYNYTAMQELANMGSVLAANAAASAENTAVSVAPAGPAVEFIFQLTEFIGATMIPDGLQTPAALFQADGITPSLQSTYLMGCAIASTVSGCTTSGIESADSAVSSQWQALLQAASDAAVFGLTNKAPDTPNYQWSSTNFSCTVSGRTSSAFPEAANTTAAASLSSLPYRRFRRA